MNSIIISIIDPALHNGELEQQVKNKDSKAHTLFICSYILNSKNSTWNIWSKFETEGISFILHFYISPQ